MIPGTRVPRARRRRGAAALLAGLGLAALVLAGCTAGGSSSGSAKGGSASSAAADAATSPQGVAAESNPNIDLGSPLGGVPAPGFTLDNQFGQPTSLSQFRGKVVLLGFEDAECTDVCPLTTQSMVLAQELLGKAGSQVQLLGVDANPGANKVSDVLAYSQAHSMVNEWDFLTGSDAQLKSTWSAYHIAVQLAAGDVDHTPALFVIDAQGREQKVYLTQMVYSSVAQSAQVIAQEVASLLPGRPALTSLESLATVPPQDPTAVVSLPAAPVPGAGSAPVALGPGKARLVVFFATWLTETSDFKAEMTSLNAYVKDAAAKHLPALTAVDETVTEASAPAVAAALHGLPALSYPVGEDKSGRLADGYGVQDQPWLVLVTPAGKITWSNDGWLPLAAIEKAAAAHA
ncbi:MAG TPA: SCO family protein [Trebonia sp.]|nr:SCO family protein [Trebonia sp.]